MRAFPWRSDDGWPYPDGEGDRIDVDGEVDDDLLAITTDRHLLDDLDPVERRVITASFGLGGAAERTMAQLHDELGLPDVAIEQAMGTGLEKLRAHLQA